MCCYTKKIYIQDAFSEIAVSRVLYNKHKAFTNSSKCFVMQVIYSMDFLLNLFGEKAFYHFWLESSPDNIKLDNLSKQIKNTA